MKTLPTTASRVACPGNQGNRPEREVEQEFGACARRGRIGGRRKKLAARKRREIAESVISGRKTGADMARLYNISQPTVSRIIAQHQSAHGYVSGSRLSRPMPSMS
jgi:hypothetical protein